MGYHTLATIHFMTSTFTVLKGYVTTAVHSTSCKNGGMIVSKDLRPNCSCKPGFKGSDCSQRGKVYISIPEPAYVGCTKGG